MNKNNFNKILKKGTILLFPFRDAFAINFLGTPFRYGELWGGMYFFTHKYFMGKKDYAQKIVILLLFNLLITLIGLALSIVAIDKLFAIKYIARNIINIVFIYGFICAGIFYSRQDIIFIFKYYVAIQFICFVILLTTGYHFYLGSLLDWESINNAGNYFQFGNLKFPRFMGTCSEAGYLAVMLSASIYHFLSDWIVNKKNIEVKYDILFFALSLIMGIFTFSAAVYLFCGIGIIASIFINIRFKKAKKALLILLCMFFISALFVLSISSIRNWFNSNVINKIMFYLGFDNADFNWSAGDRSKHIYYCWKYFSEGDFFQIIFGKGTGAYAAYADNQVDLLTDAEEGYNLFLSTLCDRGILGFILLVSLPFILKKFIVNDNCSRSIYLAIILQYLHWFITGNFWLYDFWVMVTFLIGYYRFSKLNINLFGYQKAIQKTL